MATPTLPVTVSLEDLAHLKACLYGTSRFMEQVGFDVSFSEYFLASSLVGGCNTTSDMLWLLREKLGETAVDYVTRRAISLVPPDSDIASLVPRPVALIFERIVHYDKANGPAINDILRDVFDNGVPNT